MEGSGIATISKLSKLAVYVPVLVGILIFHSVIAVAGVVTFAAVIT